MIGPEKIVAVISDNANNILRGIKLVKQNFKHIDSYGCVAHWVNLVMNDIVKQPIVKQFIKKAKAIVKYFKKSAFAFSLLENLLKANGEPVHRPVLYGKTRWSSMIGMIEFLVSSQESLKMILNKDFIKNNSKIPQVK
jgi:hypothetical protein